MQIESGKSDFMDEVTAIYLGRVIEKSRMFRMKGKFCQR